jgi:hypothetical protein
MSKLGRSQLVLGLLLILAGAWFILQRSVPSLAEFTDKFFEWPFTMLWIGALILVIGLFSGSPGMAIPAAIVAGIGGIFYANDTFNTSWAYMWTLIPGFIGIGSILAGLLGDNPRHNLSNGMNSLVVSAVLFLIFASIFGGISLLGNYMPAILLIALGAYLLGRSIWKSFSRKDGENA